MTACGGSRKQHHRRLLLPARQRAVKHVPYFPPCITVPPITIWEMEIEAALGPMPWTGWQPHSCLLNPLSQLLQLPCRLLPERWELKCLCLKPLPRQHHTCHIPPSPAPCSGTHSFVLLKPAPRLCFFISFLPICCSTAQGKPFKRQGQFWGRGQERGWSRV